MAAETPAALVAAPASTFIPRRLVDLDASLSLWIHTACLPIPRSLLKALEISGDGRFCIPIPISLLIFSSRSSPILLGLILGSLLDLPIIGLIKHIVRRPRPVYNKGMHLTFAVDHWSFPSGHSSRVFFIAAFLCLCADPLRLLLRSHRWVQGCYGARCGYCRTPSPPPPPCPPVPIPNPSGHGTCPLDTLKLGVCANVLNGLINIGLGRPPKKPCCSLLDGLVDLEAAVCLCTALKANILGIYLNIPIDLSLLLNYCGKRTPRGFQCA